MKKDIQGQRFGRLFVIKRIPRKPDDRNAMWNCRCDCGKTTVVAATNLGRTTFSCGCLQRESARKMAAQNRNFMHGMTGKPEYQAWTKMKLRCYSPQNPKYYAYGGRGIKVCKRWKESFEAFYADMGSRPSPIHSLNRINNDDNYEPSNCEWALPLTQARNARFNRIVSIDGIELCITAWCDRLDIPHWKPYEMIRVREGYKPPQHKTIDEALTALYLAKYT